jgi:peptide/nickel transport system substrate-binding protein
MDSSWVRNSFVLGLCIVIFSVVATVGQDEGVYGGTLTIGARGSITRLDRHTTTAWADSQVQFQMYEHLVAFDGNWQPMPSLASSWEILDDGLRYRFHLREGVLFHDGREMTAEDVKYSYDRCIEVNSRSAGLKELMDRTEIVDDYTFDLYLKKPVATQVLFVYLAMPHMSFGIVPKGLAEEQGGTITSPIGTGPFVFEEWQPNEFIRMSRFENYVPIDLPPSGFGGRKTVYVDELVFRPLPDITIRVASLEAGDVDMAEYLDAADYPRLLDMDGIEAGAGAVGHFLWTALNLNLEVFQDRKFRHALGYAMDNESIVQVGYGGLGSVIEAGGFLQPFVTPYMEEIGFYYDHDLAVQLLAESNYNGEEIVVTGQTTTDSARWARLVVEQWRAIGVNAVLETIETPAAVDKIANVNYDAIVWGCRPQPDPDECMQRTYGRTNTGAYFNPAVQALLDEAAVETDFDTRLALYEGVRILTFHDAPVIPGFRMPYVSARADYVKAVDGYWDFQVDAAYTFGWNIWLDK